MAIGLDLSQDELAGIESMYDATLRHMDHTVDEIVSAARSASDNLIVVIVGDHGELFGELGILGHNLALHEKLIRVPMLVTGIPGIATDEEMMSQQIDLTRTLGEVVDVETDQFERRDLRTDERPHAISQRGQVNLGAYTRHGNSFDTDQFFGEPYTVVSNGDYKLATNSKRTELYRLPDERTNYSGSEPEQVDRLQSVLEDHDISCAAGEQQHGAEFDNSQLKQLKDLGYLS